MKKILSSILLLIFFAGQVNLAWASHYCEDELISSELTFNPGSADCCGSETPAAMECCEDEVSQADADDFFKKSEVYPQLSPEFVLAYVFTFMGIELKERKTATASDEFPDLPIPDLLILHQTFLI